MYIMRTARTTNTCIDLEADRFNRPESRLMLHGTCQRVSCIGNGDFIIVDSHQLRSRGLRPLRCVTLASEPLQESKLRHAETENTEGENVCSKNEIIAPQAFGPSSPSVVCPKESADCRAHGATPTLPTPRYTTLGKTTHR
jgi:hypothetical protein